MASYLNESKLFAKAFLHLFKLISAKRIAEVLEVEPDDLKKLKEWARLLVEAKE